jgi:hypothetical protein
MDTEHLELADLPQLSEAVERGPFVDYSVGLCRVRDQKLTFLGSGVLVKKGGRWGILTAHHCLHVPGVRLGPLECDELYLVLRLGHSVRVQPDEAIEHILVKPHSEEYGPDLTFIQILAVQRRASLEAIGSFYSLDHPPSEIAKDFAGVGTPVLSVGFPEGNNTERTERGRIRLRVAAMQLAPNAIEDGDISEEGGWDYIETHLNESGTSGLPTSFKGFSGGPVWGMKLRKHKKDGHISIEKHALVGINFYEVPSQNNERRMRAHFIKSIYELAWTNLG